MKFQKVNVVSLECAQVREDNIDEIRRIMSASNAKNMDIQPTYPDWSDYGDGEWDGTKFYGISMGPGWDDYEEGAWIGVWGDGHWFWMDFGYSDDSVRVGMPEGDIKEFPSEEAFWVLLRKLDD